MENEKTEIEKLNLNSMNIAEEKQSELLRLFPEIRTEGGKIDFEKLKLALGELVDTGKERYGMNWPGKSYCHKTIQTPSSGTLLPELSKSLNFDSAENLFIEGDNLEVLKLLQKAYLNSIAVIYIDPPYNTGNDFVYPDDYSESLQTYLQYTGQIDAEGKKFGTNIDSDGRFHSKWMNMIYPRLYLAKNLLKENGIIFISIDDHEYTNIRRICDEIFGEENFVTTFCVQSNPRGSQSKSQAAIVHEYIIAYAKDIDFLEPLSLPLNDRMIAEYSLSDGDGKYRLLGLRQRGGAWRREERPTLYYPFYVNPKKGTVSLEKSKEFTEEVYPVKPSTGEDGSWRWSKKKYQENIPLIIAKKVSRDDREVWDIYQKDYLLDGKDTKLKTIIDSKEVNYQNGTKEVKELFKDKDYFDFPKPIELIKTLIMSVKADHNHVVLDFFAGSGTTAQAVMRANKLDRYERKFILVQLPENLSPEANALKDGYKTISQISLERVKRAIEKESVDIGVRVFKLSDSNFKTWSQDTDSKDGLTKQLELHVDHVKQERTADDILYEILLKSGFPLTTKVETQKLGKQTVYSIAGGMLLVCLEDNLTLELIKHIAEQKPERVVCLDQGFANNDQLKTNAVQIFRTKGIASFKTV